MIVSFIKVDARNYCLAPLWKSWNYIGKKHEIQQWRSQPVPVVIKLCIGRSQTAPCMLDLVRAKIQSKMSMI